MGRACATQSWHLSTKLAAAAVCQAFQVVCQAACQAACQVLTQAVLGQTLRKLINWTDGVEYCGFSFLIESSTKQMLRAADALRSSDVHGIAVCALFVSRCMAEADFAFRIKVV